MSDAADGVQTPDRSYPAGVESRPGYYRTGTRCPWAVYRVGFSGRREDDERYAVLFDPADAGYLVMALNAAVDRGDIPVLPVTMDRGELS